MKRGRRAGSRGCSSARSRSCLTPLRPFVIVLAVAGLHLLFSSNTVTATIIVPILVALAQDLRLDVWSIVAPAAFTSSLAFILVTEGPTTLIPYASGYSRSRTWPRRAS